MLIKDLINGLHKDPEETYKILMVKRQHLASKFSEAKDALDNLDKVIRIAAEAGARKRRSITEINTLESELGEMSALDLDRLYTFSL